MTEITGTYYDGVGSQGQTATLRFEQDWVVLTFAGGQRSLPMSDLELEAALGNMPRRVHWGGRDSFVTQDHAGLAVLASLLSGPVKLSRVAWLEQHMTVAVVGMILVVVGFGGFAVWGVPWVATGVASATPERISAQLGASTLETIDTLLSPSQLSLSRRANLSNYFREHGDIQTLTFRQAKRLGPNALTLSATTVLFTDELVALAEDDEELLAVYLHELGHARLHHVERSILQSSAWLVLITVFTGDLSSASELVLSLPLIVGQAAYTRDLEREADAFAVRELQRAGVSPLKLASILQRLEDFHRHDNDDDDDEQAEPAETSAADKSYSEVVFEYLSTHPATEARIAYIRSQVKN